MKNATALNANGLGNKKLAQAILDLAKRMGFDVRMFSDKLTDKDGQTIIVHFPETGRRAEFEPSLAFEIDGGQLKAVVILDVNTTNQSASAKPSAGVKLRKNINRVGRKFGAPAKTARQMIDFCDALVA